ncbi:hypothetical protein Pyn_41019 [Prunus yedoensis var. nudiflora]|uniref:Uncharacterized protein n=1 Tax=Prunus yedoensis var. nudiflora TaxID=2094558 RepID=A0A314Z420_PRUYE|nr:hypothetical protein Pyn_41019 [Prunus yedoensis var. nudiflora]
MILWNILGSIETQLSKRVTVDFIECGEERGTAAAHLSHFSGHLKSSGSHNHPRQRVDITHLPPSIRNNGLPSTPVLSIRSPQLSD